MQQGLNADKPLGYAQIAVDAAVGLGAIPAGTCLVLITPEGQPVRFRDDGVAPTAVAGYPVAVGSEVSYTGSQMGLLQFIGQAAGGKINVLFYGS